MFKIKNISSTTVKVTKHNIYPTQGYFYFIVCMKSGILEIILKKKYRKNIKYESHAICDVTMTKVENNIKIQIVWLQNKSESFFFAALQMNIK